MASENRKANLFIVGAMRAGTTSFMELLAQHPEIYTSPIKEPHFFIKKLPKEIFEPLPSGYLERYFKNDFPKPIHRAQIKTIEDYTKLFEIATTEKYLAEGSVSYLHAPEVAQGIYNYNPTAKIIILIRDPLERAFSQYNMDVGLGRETRSFEAVMCQQLEAFDKNTLQWYSCLGLSLYDQAINNYKQYFDDVIILKFEALQNDTVCELKKVALSLGIEDFYTPEFPKKNTSREAGSPKFIHTLKEIGVMRIVSNLFGKKLKTWIWHQISKSHNQAIVLPQAINDRLSKVFKHN